MRLCLLYRNFAGFASINWSTAFHCQELPTSGGSRCDKDICVCTKNDRELQGTEESCLTVFPVKFTAQLSRESICCWFKSLYVIKLYILSCYFFEKHSWITFCKATKCVATFIFERRNSTNNGMRTGVNFFPLLSSHATCASRSPRFTLCSPKIRKKLRLFCSL